MLRERRRMRRFKARIERRRMRRMNRGGGG
jgi:hypothetical protein